MLKKTKKQKKVEREGGVFALLATFLFIFFFFLNNISEASFCTSGAKIMEARVELRIGHGVRKKRETRKLLAAS